MKLFFCGGASEVGASCILLKLAGKNFVFDTGVRMAQNKDFLPDLRMIQENGGVDAIFVSHAHIDHIGSLPVLSSEFPNARIFMTHATKDLMRVLLYDSLKIMENREQEIPIFSEPHVKNTLDRVLCYSPGYTFRPFGESFEITFYNAGHIAGAAAIYVVSQEGAFFYSGDFSVSRQRTVEGASIPRLRPDVAVFESTYGDRLHANREIEEQRLIAKVNEIIEAKKKILIPAFALGRAQEVVLILKRAINKGQLSSCKIYVDGMVNDICRVYSLNPNYLNHQLTNRIMKGNEIFYDDNITAITKRQTQREEIMSSSEPCCIISSSGMLTGGPSQWYAAWLAGDEGNYIALTGYQDEESPGRQLLALAEGDAEERILKLGDISIPVNCGIGKYGLSAHADKTEILALVHSLGPKNVFFVHGNSEVTEQLAKDLQKDFRGRAFAPKNGEEYDPLINVPRKQLYKDDLPTLASTTYLTEEEIPKLWALIMNHFHTKRGFTFEELAYIWSGRRDADYRDFFNSELINNSKFFKAENRRPFIFHAQSEEDIIAVENNTYMEVNSMLALVDKYFPPSTGLYKKGARFDEKITILSFVFPKRACQLKDEIENFEFETKWQVEINSECNQLEAQNLIKKLFSSEEQKIEKISYLPLEDAFKVKVNRPIDRKEKVIKEFFEMSGMKIIIEGLAYNGKGNKTTEFMTSNSEAAKQMEQNMAMKNIQDAFANMPDKIYKKRLKNDGSQRYIELSFISPIVGERYKELIEQLERKIYWNIRVGQSVNQHEVLNIAKRLLENNGAELKKSPAFLPKEMQVVVNLFSQPTDFPAIKENFFALTGLELSYKIVVQ